MIRFPLTLFGIGVGTITYTNYKLTNWFEEKLEGLEQFLSLVKGEISPNFFETEDLKGVLNSFRDFFSIPEEDEYHYVDKGLDKESPTPSPNSSKSDLVVDKLDREEIDKESGRTILEDEGQEKKETSFVSLTKKLIEIRHLLKEIDMNQTLINFPTIVVIGSQSSGKSSVLEGLVGKEFLPKGDNMVTRRPIELTLIHTPDTQEEYGEFPSLGIQKLKDFTKIQSILTELNRSVSESEAISNIPIDLRIYSSKVPNLSLVDLPGYIQIHNKKQSPKLKEKIQLLCQKYIQAPNIILAISAADVDLANSESLRASRIVDPLGLRTVGVITKMDLIDGEKGQQLLNNNEFPLKLGYIGVVNQSNRQSHYQKFYQEKNLLFGQKQLKRNLIEILEEHMKQSLEKIVYQVKRELEDTKYYYKVQYHDRILTPETYLAETMDGIKHHFKELSEFYTPVKIRDEIRTIFEQKMLDVFSDIYWNDVNLLSTNLEEQTPHLKEWERKFQTSSDLLTKIGIGRMTTKMIIENFLKQFQKEIFSTKELQYHFILKKTLDQLVESLLKEKYYQTFDQVENILKPYKYDIEFNHQEWKEYQLKALDLLDSEFQLCQQTFQSLKKSLKLSNNKLSQYFAKLSQQEEAVTTSFPHKTLDPQGKSPNTTKPMASSPELEDKIQRLFYLKNRLKVLKMRRFFLKNSCQDKKNYLVCPEIYFKILLEKILFTTTTFIYYELLQEFYFQFPRKLDEIFFLNQKPALTSAPSLTSSSLSPGASKTPMNSTNFTFSPSSNSSSQYQEISSNFNLLEFCKENPNVFQQIQIFRKKCLLEKVLNQLLGLIHYHSIHTNTSPSEFPRYHF